MTPACAACGAVLEPADQFCGVCGTAVATGPPATAVMPAGERRLVSVLFADLVGYTANWVRTIIRRYNTDGPAGIVDGRHANPGAPPLLSPERQEALRAALSGPSPDGGLWTARKVARWMAEHLGRPIGEVRGWEAMRALGFTPQRPRPRATTADPVAQTAFKKGGSKRRLTPSGPPTRPRR